jgi:hypothetical protein
VHSAAYAVSSLGDVVGESQKGADTVAVVWPGGSPTATELSLGGFTAPSVALAIAGSRIVGHATLGGNAVAVLWATAAAAPAPLGTLPSGTTSRAYGISDEGLVVGEADDELGADRAVFWRIAPGGTVSGPFALHLGADVTSVAFGVSGSEVVGESQAADGTLSAVRWTVGADNSSTGPTALGSGGASGVSGQRVVGHFAADDQAALWDLRNVSLWEPTENAPSQAYGINGSGDVVGLSGAEAFVATPR